MEIGGDSGGIGNSPFGPSGDGSFPRSNFGPGPTAAICRRVTFTVAADCATGPSAVVRRPSVLTGYGKSGTLARGDDWSITICS